MERKLIKTSILDVQLNLEMRIENRVVGNWVKFHKLMYSGHLHKYSMKEGFLTS